MKDKLGLIDIGSNTIRLVIFQKLDDGRRFKEIENIKSASHLRTYLNGQNSLTEEGIGILLETLQRFKKILNIYEVTEVICVATATIRQAGNKDSIVQIIQEKTGLTVNILSEFEEAYYGYSAVVHSIDINEGITIDMGGGSTELTYFCDRKLVKYISLPFGSLSLKFQFIKGDIPTNEELLQIREYLQSQFANIPWIEDKQIPIIAMGGSARNIARIHQSLVHYPLAGIHQYEMKVTDILELKEKLERLSFNQLQNLEGLSKDRIDTILPALEVFELLCDRTKASAFVLSRKGLREGVLLGKRNSEEDVFTSLVDSNLNELMKEHHLDGNKADNLKRIAVRFFEQVKGIKGIGSCLSECDLTLLKRGANIYHLGKFENEESSAFTFYLLANRTIVGLTHKERVNLALVSSYKGKGTFRQYIEPFKTWYTKEERKRLCILGAILKLSQCLNILDRNIVNGIKITSHEDNWVMDIECTDHYEPEQYQLEKQKKHLEKLIKIKLATKFYLIKSKTKSK